MEKKESRTVCLINLGCAKNLVDSEVMLGLLSEAGYIPYPDPERASVVVINTCGFIGPARRENRREIRRAVRRKIFHPDQLLAVVGCYVEKDRERLAREFPEVDLWLGVKDLAHIVPLLQERPWHPSRHTFLYDEKMPRLLSTPSTWAYIKIAEGCSHSCSFCTIPGIKGPYRSRSIASIIREARMLAEAGVKEINLISQDTTYFGRDRHRESQLPRLLEELVKIRNLAWIRWLYGYPEEVDEALLEVMEEPKICPYFDLPFQHSHRSLLSLMRRGFDGRRALRLIERIRRRLPDAVLRTSLIVGFPGEGEREFQDLLDFIREAEFDHLGVFTYSREPGTEAYSLGDPVPPEVKKRRKQQIMELQAEISRRRLLRFLGRRLEVLLDGTGNPQRRIFFGRTRFQAPEVDGKVSIYLSRGENPPRPGLGQVEITRTGIYDLRGRWIG